MIELFVFDFDNVIHNPSYGFRKKVFQPVLDYFNLKVDDIELKKIWFGDLSISKYDVDARKFWEKFVEYDTPELRLKYLMPYYDISVINKLNTKKAIISSSMKESVEVIVNKLGLEFDYIISANIFTGIKPKPSPESMNICLKKLKVKKENTIYVGDTESDILFAKNSEVQDVFLKRAEYEINITPTKTITSLYDLKELYIDSFN